MRPNNLEALNAVEWKAMCGFKQASQLTIQQLYMSIYDLDTQQVVWAELARAPQGLLLRAEGLGPLS